MSSRIKRRGGLPGAGRFDFRGENFKMAEEHFHVAVTDEQLEAARVSAAARGVNLGPVGSMSRDGVTINYTIEKDDAGANDVSVYVLYRPFYVPADTVQSLITEFLTNPPAPPAPPAPPVEASAKSAPPVEPPAKPARPQVVETAEPAHRHKG
jgi:hypothetical protein